MVGVPRSRGCPRCIRRRVKCDETRPECLRCLNRGLACPGYHRAHTFKDQTQIVIQKHGRSTIDEIFAPGLAYEAIGIQTRESFERWLDYYFPHVNACVQSRVQVGWMGFLRSGWATFPPALVWAVRALTALLMGASYGNKQAIWCARHMYSRGIRHLATLIQTEAALTDETLAAAILLGGYEVLDGSSDRSWIIHARGISQLMRARGPFAHEKGMGRTLLMCWRPYIVAEAFIHGGPCFLGEPEWVHTSMTKEIASAEDAQGMGSLIGQVADYAFNEIAKCPGYLATTKEAVRASSPGCTAKLDSIMDDVSQTRANLVRLDRMLTVTEPPANFVGVIPWKHATILMHASRESINTAVALLDHLLTTLQSISGCATKSQWLGPRVQIVSMHDDQSKHLFSARQTADLLPRQQFRSQRDPEDTDPGEYAIGDRLDQFSLTMGMGSLYPDSCGIPQLSANDTMPGCLFTSSSGQMP